MTAAYDGQKNALSRTPSTLVIISMDDCQESHGDAPCLASGAPCFNTYKTCTYKSAYDAGVKEYKFCLNDTPQPLPGEIIRPYIKGLQDLSQEIRLDESILINQRTTITMLDEPDSDIGVDPYRVSPTSRSSTGGSDSIATAGTFWRKFRARNPHYKNRRVTIKQGFVAPGFLESDYVTSFEGVLDNIKVGGNGEVQLVVKGLLQLTDVEYPKKTDGLLGAAVSSGATSFTLAAWSGVDRYAATPASLYTTTGGVLIGDEVITYTSRTLDTATGITTFTGLTRGAYNGYGYAAAAAHDANDEIQQVVYMSGNPLDHMHTLLNEAGIVDADIDTLLLAGERDTWFNGITFATVLHEPVKIKKLLSELREQTLTYIYQGEDQKIKVKFLGPIEPGETYRQITDADNIIYSSRAIDDNEAGRFTRAVTRYDIYANKTGKEAEHFRRAAVYIDSDAESAIEYNEKKDRPAINSRWIKSLDGGDTIARVLASRIVTRFRNGAKVVSFDLDRKDEDIELGEVFELSSDAVVDYDGNPKVARYVVTKKQRKGMAKISVTAVDTQLQSRYAYVAPAAAPDYGSATDAQKEYAYVADGTPPVTGSGDPPYLII